MLPDTALRRRAALPDRIAWEGSATAEREVYSLASVLTAGPGGAAPANGRSRNGPYRVAGPVRYTAEGLRGDNSLRQFPVGEFSAVGFARQARSNALGAQGEGFDPLAGPNREKPVGGLPGRVSRARLRQARRGEAGLAEGRLTGRIEDRDSASAACARESKEC